MLFGLDYQTQVWIYRVAIWVAPLVVLIVTKRVCDELRAGERAEYARRAAEQAVVVD